MKLQLKKTALLNLSEDFQVVPAALTPQVAGAAGMDIQSSYPSAANGYTCNQPMPTQDDSNYCRALNSQPQPQYHCMA